MTRRKRVSNPFYAVLLIVGVVFVITACAYAVMGVRGIDPHLAAEATASDQTFLELMDQYGFAALLVELVLLAAATFAAIATDDYWSRRGGGSSQSTQDHLPQS